MAEAHRAPVEGTAELRSRVGELHDRLTELESTVAGVGDVGEGGSELPSGHFAALLEHARQDWTHLSSRADEALRTADIAAREQIAWERDAIDVERIGRQLEIELDTIHAELQAHGSDDEAAEAAWRAVGESWRARADELRVQANLAGKDLRAQAHEGVDRVDDAVESLRVGIEQLGERAADASRDLGRPLGDLIDRARAASRDTGRWLAEHTGTGGGRADS